MHRVLTLPGLAMFPRCGTALSCRITAVASANRKYKRCRQFPGLCLQLSPRRSPSHKSFPALSLYSRKSMQPFNVLRTLLNHVGYTDDRAFAGDHRRLRAGDRPGSPCPAPDPTRHSAGPATECGAGAEHQHRSGRAGHPGTLPVVNRRLVEYTLRMGLATNCRSAAGAASPARTISIPISRKATRSRSSTSRSATRAGSRSSGRMARSSGSGSPVSTWRRMPASRSTTWTPDRPAAGLALGEGYYAAYSGSGLQPPR